MALSGSQLKGCIVGVMVLPMVVNAGEVDPFTGAYYGEVDFAPLTIIKKHNDRYFAKVATGSVELEMSVDGQFKAKNPQIDISGQFGNKVDGKYQSKQVDIYGSSYVYQRKVLEKPAITALYSADGSYSAFSPTSHSQCSSPFPNAEKATHKLLTQSSKMAALIKNIEQGRYDYGNIDSLLILKDGDLVFERYFNGWQQEEPHTVQSVSKSLTSLLYGMAEKQGMIQGDDSLASTYLPKYRALFDGEKTNITIKHLLTMSSGLYWDEWSTSYEDPNNIRIKEMMSDDSVAFTLSQDMIHTPGEQFVYSGGSVGVIGEVVREASGHSSVSDYAMKGPLAALCFQNAFWVKQNDQRSNVAGGVYLRPRDMLKLGLLVLNNGNWNGKSLVDAKWLENSTTPVIKTGLTGSEYSYYWWNTTYRHNGKHYPAIKAMGYGGQDIVIVKALDLVVVKTASNFHSRSLIDSIMVNQILPTFVR
ncbi:serine hydrolase domain-containing protein [Photobacterium minamisatsumaniensis]|uniref:serine hydrolase domain-containing protein n=1 Tax=Photobacterium minamisatsumaniensis TaxID=2910233 RepID=UPI003D0F0DAE